MYQTNYSLVVGKFIGVTDENVFDYFRVCIDRYLLLRLTPVNCTLAFGVSSFLGMQVVFYHMSAILFCGLQFKYNVMLAVAIAIILSAMMIKDTTEEEREYVNSVFLL